MFILFVAQLSANCAVEDAATRKEVAQTSNIEEAKNWFQQYKLTTTFKPIFNNLVYDWANSKVETLENNSQAIIVAVFNENQEGIYSSRKLLYFYPVESVKSFETTLYEFLSTAESLKGQSLIKNLSNFDGYIVVWSLEKGFIESTKFEKSVNIATILATNFQEGQK